MRATLNVISAGLVVCASLLLWAEGGAGASGGKGAKPVSAVKLSGPAFAALETITPDHIRWHVRYLSHDLLEGRGTGQRGGEIAAEYIATQFAEYGLKPAGDHGTYMQRVPLVGITTLPETQFSLVPKQGETMNLRPLDEYVAYDQTQQPQSDVDADIVFVGYGIEAPEYNWDDYKGLDVRGKVLLILVNEPSSDDPKFFKGKALTYYGRWTYKYEEAARKGAVGVILIHQTQMASYPWEVVRNSNSGEKSFLKLEGPALKVASWAQLDVAKRLASASGMDLDKMMQDAQSRDFHPMNLHAKLRAHMVSKVRHFESTNVVAILPGSDRKLADEAVLYTAHYDHFGIRPDMPGDNIFNGANDNATGCGILIELARAFGTAAQRPRRSILFAAVTAEEQGLLGSEYLGKHPPIPAGKITLDLNYDAVMPLGAPEEVEVAGAERTTFYPAVESTAKDFRLAIRPDAMPEAGHFYRSDHFSLARVGIPAFSINEGTKYKGHPASWGLDQQHEYIEKHYHQPSDEYHADMDFVGDSAMARFGFALGWEAATLPKLIEWQNGDEFAPARAKRQ
ncbi:MAG TPA: M28 family peptidase [Candidatus Sulfotelmatobacter sp.]|jgi:Zn-dependent M28 family amino/carboxypeptidase|nr:M28 family peptidase [Candidatus Sulfotelmatobacter sp.]